jgi:hypothetical protein
MNPLIKRLTQEAAAPLEDMLARLIKTAALVAMAAGCAIAASVFLTMDLYLFIEGRFGPLVAAACVAGLYLLGVVFLILALPRPYRAPGPIESETAMTPLMAASVGAEAAQAPRRNPVYAANIDAAVAPVLNVLRDAGLDKEVLAIEAGTEVAKQLNPLSLVAFAVGAGVLIGRTLRR